MKIAFLLMCSVPIVLKAQSVDYNKVILPDRIVAETFEERLVQLAWRNHPSNKIVQQNVAIAEKERSKAKWEWLDNFYIAGNLNEYTLNPEKASVQVFYPRYNFGVRFSLGTFVSTPLDTKIATDRLTNSQHLVNQQKLTVREEVLTTLEKMKQHYKFIRLRERIREDYLNMYKDAEKKFGSGEINMERYRGAVQTYYTRSEEVIEAQSLFNQMKLILESMVGVKLEEIEGYDDFIRKLQAEAQIE